MTYTKINPQTCRFHRTIQILDWTSYKGETMWRTIDLDPRTHCSLSVSSISLPLSVCGNAGYVNGGDVVKTDLIHHSPLSFVRKMKSAAFPSSLTSTTLSVLTEASKADRFPAGRRALSGHNTFHHISGCPSSTSLRESERAHCN